MTSYLSTPSASSIIQHLASSSSSMHDTTGPSRSSPHASPPHGSNSPRTGTSKSVTAIVDVETVLRANGGDLGKALEAVISERNSLQAQNTQLWKLIEKQRAQSAHLVADNERVRLDRERANSKLLAAGLEPITGKRLPNSSSAIGLGLRPQAPMIRRNNSDRDEKMIAPTLQVPSTSAPIPSQATPSPTVLLPSPMSESKLRPQSRMTFPPEVSSFMTLADSPRNATHIIPPLPTSTSNNTLSPSSQYSASPSVSGRDEALAVPPTSGMTLTVTTESAGEEQPRPHTPQEPPPRSSSIRSPPLVSSPSFSSVGSDYQSFRDTSPLPSASPRPSYDMDTPRASIDPTAYFDPLARPLPRLALALLPHTRLTIPSSAVHPNQLGRDVLTFIVAITLRPPNAQPVTWSVAKLFSAFIDLDTKIKAKAGRARKEWKSMVTPLPEGRAWKDFAPSKIDQRKKALEAYLQSLLIAPISDKTDLCDFLSTDPVQARVDSTRKEGYLTKKGKSFGGWRTRYFVLDGPIMEYYETRGGPHLGSIIITNAMIGRQNRSADTSDERDFRHAFLIVEQGRKGSTQRHVLCAESDDERDSWIDALFKHVEPAAIPQADPTPGLLASALQRRRSNSRKSSKDVVVTAAQPMAAMPGPSSKFAGAPSPSLINSMESKRVMIQDSHQSGSTPSVINLAKEATSSTQDTPTKFPLRSESRPVIGSPEPLPTSPPTNDPTPRATKRQSMMPSRPSHSAAYLTKLSNDGMSAPPGYDNGKDRERKAKSGRFWPTFGKAPEKLARPVFGVPIADSIAVASVANLPAIVFRCIEWLEAKGAEQEEGIYRLSGSSAVMKGLKDRFDVEGDVNLVAVDEHWDPHAIAGLLKLFLRDLPSSLLTTELHRRFLAVMDLVESSARVTELSRLVSELPPNNYALLRALTAHLILIVRHAASNKMTLRNIGIVFSPTLGIPAGIFSDLVSHFGAIFDDAPDDDLVQIGSQTTLSAPNDGQETIKRNRNSMLYQAGGADAMLGLSGRALDPAEDDSASEADTDDPDSESPSVQSSDNLSLAATPRADIIPYPTPTRTARPVAKSLTIDALPGDDHATIRSPQKSTGSSHSPRPPGAVRMDSV